MILSIHGEWIEYFWWIEVLILLSFCTIFLHSLLACRISFDRSFMNHMGFPLHVSSFIDFAAFNILSVFCFWHFESDESWIFSIWLFFFLLGLWISWIKMPIFHQIWEIPIYNFFNYWFFINLFSFSWGTQWFLYCSSSHNSLVYCLFLFIPFPIFCCFLNVSCFSS